jgi:hypothetical protein
MVPPRGGRGGWGGWTSSPSTTPRGEGAIACVVWLSSRRAGVYLPSLLHALIMPRPTPPLSPRINGLSHINLTKLDVLSGLDEIKVGVAYRTPQGKLLTTVPSDLALLEACTVEYDVLPGWKADISGVRSWEEMPEAAKR